MDTALACVGLGYTKDVPKQKCEEQNDFHWLGERRGGECGPLCLRVTSNPASGGRLVLVLGRGPESLRRPFSVLVRSWSYRLQLLSQLMGEVPDTYEGGEVSHRHGKHEGHVVSAGGEVPPLGPAAWLGEHGQPLHHQERRSQEGRGEGEPAQAPWPRATAIN